MTNMCTYAYYQTDKHAYTFCAHHPFLLNYDKNPSLHNYNIVLIFSTVNICTLFHVVMNLITPVLFRILYALEVQAK